MQSIFCMILTVVLCCSSLLGLAQRVLAEEVLAVGQEIPSRFAELSYSNNSIKCTFNSTNGAITIETHRGRPVSNIMRQYG